MADFGSEADIVERQFHSVVRDYIICMLIFFCFNVLAYSIVQTLKKRTDADDFCAGDPEDFLVYKISSMLCSFSLSVSIGAVLLLPFSIISNEILLLYPNNYYMQWLNSSLIHSLWNYVFLLSNSCLFVCLPFAYFFIESQGLSGLRKGIMTRVYETLAVCVLLIVIVVFLAHLISIFYEDDSSSRFKLLFNVWTYRLPFIYSCVSFFGAVILLTCTPLGFAHMFSVVNEMVMRPRLRKDVETELQALRMELAVSQRKLPLQNGHHANGDVVLNGGGLIYHQYQTRSRLNGTTDNSHKSDELSLRIAKLEKQKTSSLWLHNLKYVFVMLLLLFLTSVSVLMVINNTLQLLVGFKSLPSESKYVELGNISLSPLGVFGAVIQVIIILYLMIASLVGFYSVPVLRQLKPSRGQTSMTKVIGNCVVLMILSSALPVLSRTLGITNFDLLGNFGRLNWLGNFQLVWWYNAAFAVATSVCLCLKFTNRVRHELLKRLLELVQWVYISTSRPGSTANSQGDHSVNSSFLLLSKDKAL